MANDPDRDVLPVKDTSEKRGFCGANPHTVSRLKRSDLEDQFIRLYEENNHLKGLVNTIQGKVNILGTKLVRIATAKQRESKETPLSRNQGDDQLQMRLKELEHDNYVLKDKNTVLKQQLASHCGQHMAMAINRVASPARCLQRQISIPDINEQDGRTNSPELHMRDAKPHLATLNEQSGSDDEIKRLHMQIASLQKLAEKLTITRQKTQVEDAIELIKLRRQTKEYSSQLSLAQHAQRVMEVQVSQLQQQNEEALQIIAQRQNEMIEIETKLEEASRMQLQLEEMKATIADLTSERDLLRERCKALMKTISVEATEHNAHIPIDAQQSAEP